jgi:hypothetical protein
MIWLTWRQFRPQAVAAAIALAVTAIALAASRPSVGSAYSSSGLSVCHADCGTLVSTFLLDLNPLDRLLWVGGIVIMFLAPALIGLFWGAPLIARELEAGTHRIVWNQTVTRAHWILVKLGLVGLAAVATAGLLSLLWTWWASPIDRATSLMHGAGNVDVAGANAAFGLSRLEPVEFAARGVVPVGYAAFAFALGVTAGLLLRRTLPAMAVTLVVFVLIQILVPNVIRPHLLPPAHATTPLSAGHLSISVNDVASTGQSTIRVTGPGFSQPGAWVLSDITITPSGAPFTRTPRACDISFAATRSGAADMSQLAACRSTLAAMHLRQFATYQPASRFWPLQWIETGMYLLLAGGLGGLCGWQVRRRRVA